MADWGGGHWFLWGKSCGDGDHDAAGARLPLALPSRITPTTTITPTMEAISAWRSSRSLHLLVDHRVTALCEHVQSSRGLTPSEVRSLCERHDTGPCFFLLPGRAEGERDGRTTVGAFPSLSERPPAHHAPLHDVAAGDEVTDGIARVGLVVGARRKIPHTPTWRPLTPPLRCRHRR